MDNIDPKSRLKLNFQGYNTDRNFQPSNERVFPTTPSTFPQPVFGASNGAAATVDHGGYATGGGAGTAAQGHYGAQPNNQAGGYFPSYNPSSGAHSPLAQSSATFAGPRTNQNFDPTSPLTSQFANQSLGAPQRQASPFGRQVSPVPRTYSPTNGQAARSPHGLPLPTQDSTGRSLSMTAADEPPPKMPGKYPPGIAKRGANLHAFVETFFKENISRARERNKR